MQKLNFSIDDYTLQEISESQIMELEMKVVSEGDNNHGLPITRDAIINSAETIIGKPVLFKFNKAMQDLMGHETDEIACGVCGLTKDDYYFKEIDGKLWLIVKAYLWKLYFEEVINVFERDKEKAISMEMFITDSEYSENEETTSITGFCFAGVTLLGKVYLPAIDDANAVVTKYSKISDAEFKEYMNNTKEILRKYIKADIPNNIKIPKTLKTKEEDKLEKFDKAKFLKEFSMTANEMKEKMENALSGYKCKDGYCRYAVRDFCNKYVYARDWEDETVVAIPYSFSNKQPMVDLSNSKYAYMRYVIDEDSEAKSEDIVQMYADQEIAKVKEKLEKDKNKEIKEYSEKIDKLEKDINEKSEKLKTYKSEKENNDKQIKEYSEKIENIEKENSVLNEFKSNIEKQEKENKINYAINSVKDSLTEDQIKEWTNKVDEFETVESFTNAIQAFAYTQTKNIKDDENIHIHIPITQEKEKKGLWD